MLRILVDGGGEGPSNEDITQAELIAACAAGPLKELFENPFAEPSPGDGVSVWGDLIADRRLSTYVTPGGPTESDGIGGFRYIAGTPNLLRVTASGEVIVELRYHPTAVR